MKPPKISVVIPSYNKVRFIKHTLDSIFKQNYQNLELIIQDGGSTDGTLEILRKYLANYPKIIKLESKKDLGQSDALNKGLKKATGEILSFINADDVYLGSPFSDIAAAYLKNPDALWFSGRGIVIDENGRETAKIVTWYKNLLLALNSLFFLKVTNYLMQPSVFFTRSAYQKYGPITGIKKGIIEYELWLKLGNVSMPVVINKNLSAFRMSGENISALYFSETLKADGLAVRKYVKNPIILLLHDLHNLGRVIVNKFL